MTSEAKADRFKPKWQLLAGTLILMSISFGVWKWLPTSPKPDISSTEDLDANPAIALPLTVSPLLVDIEERIGTGFTSTLDEQGAMADRQESFVEAQDIPEVDGVAQPNPIGEQPPVASPDSQLLVIDPSTITKAVFATSERIRQSDISEATAPQSGVVLYPANSVFDNEGTVHGVAGEIPGTETSLPGGITGPAPPVSSGPVSIPADALPGRAVLGLPSIN